MISKKKANSYNHGVCGVYVEKTTLINDFNAKRNAKTIDDYEFIMNLYYSVENMREEDFEFAERMGKRLTMKIRTPLVDTVLSNHKIIIDSLVYDIIRIDPNIKNRDLYLHLEGGRKVEK